MGRPKRGAAKRSEKWHGQARRGDIGGTGEGQIGAQRARPLVLDPERRTCLCEPNYRTQRKFHRRGNGPSSFPVVDQCIHVLLIHVVNSFHAKYVRESNPMKNESDNDLIYLKNNLSNPKPEHTTGGSVRGGARRGGGAGLGRTGRRRNGPPRMQPSLAPSMASQNVLNDTPEARTSEILCKPMGEHNGRLTRGLKAGREVSFVLGCWRMYRRLFVFVNLFHPKLFRIYR